MNLLDLMIKVGIEDEYTKGMSTLVSNISSQAGMIVAQLAQIQSSLNQLKDKSIKVDADTNGADNALDKLSAKSIALANTIAQEVVGALKSAAGAVKDFFESAFSAYGEYEQQVGAIETFFGDAASTVIENAQSAYKTAGMSANEYMQNVNNVAMSIINSVKNDRAAALQEDVDTQQKALDQQVTNLKRALDEEYTEAQRASARAKQAYSDQLSDQLDELRNSLNAELKERREALAEATNLFREQLQEQLEEQRKAYQEQLQQRRNELQAEYDAKNKQLSNSYSALQKSLDKEVDAFRKATNKKVKEIDREYRERLKLTDKAEYDRLAEIQKQIDALEGQSEAEKEAAKKREQQQKIDELEYKSTHEKYAKDRLKAEQDLADLRADIERESRDKQRKVAIEKLKQQQDDVRDHYDKQRENLRDYYDEEEEKYKESRDDELDLLRESNKTKLEIAAEGNKLLLNNIKVASDKELTELQEKFDKELQQMSKTNSELLKERQKSDSQQIEELQEHHNQIIKEQQRANRDALTEFGYGEADKLKALKQSHEDQLNELKEYVKNQKSVLKTSGDNIGEYVDATEEDLKRAAEVADTMVKDMADNHNKTGQSLELLEFAYNGMSRGEFRMLDNLRLGFRGNKAGMQELIDQANLLKDKYGETGKFSIDSFQDIVDAIHMVQVEQGIAGVSTDELKGKMRDNDFTIQELNKLGKQWSGNPESVEANVEAAKQKIAEFGKEGGDIVRDHFDDFRELLGTTAVEGDKTLQGALGRLRGSWENWLTSLTDEDWKVEKTTTELVDSAANAAKLIIPRFVDIIEALSKEVGPQLGDLWERFKEGVLNAIPPEWKEKHEKFMGDLSTIMDKFDEIVGVVKNVAIALGGITALSGIIGIVNGISGAVEAVSAAVGPLFELLFGSDVQIIALSGATAEAAGSAGILTTAFEALTGPIGAAIALFTAMYTQSEDLRGVVGDLANGVKFILGEAFKLINPIIETAKVIWDGLCRILKDLGDAVASILGPAIKTLGDTLGPPIQGVVDAFTSGLNHLKDAVGLIFEGITNLKPILDVLAGIFGTLADVLASVLGPAFGMIIDVVGGTFAVTFDAICATIEWLAQLFADVTKAIGDFVAGGAQQIEDFRKGVDEHMKVVTDWFAGFQSALNEFFKDPAKWLYEAGKAILEGLFNGIKSIWDDGNGGGIAGFFTGMGSWIENNKGPVEADRQILVPAGEAIMEGLDEGINDVWSKTSGFFESISDKLTDMFLGASDWLWSAGSNIMEGLYDGISSMWDSVANFITGINDWLIMNKGPEQRDKTMLIPAGKWIMGGFKKGLENGFSKDVAPYVEDMNAFMEGSFGNMNPGDASEWAYEVSNSIVKAFEDASKLIVSSFDEAFMSIEHMATRSSNAMAEQMANMLPGVIRGTSSANGFAGGAQPPQQTVVLQLDGIEFGKMVYRYYNKEAYRIGVNVGSN